MPLLFPGESKRIAAVTSEFGYNLRAITSSAATLEEKRRWFQTRLKSAKDVASLTSLLQNEGDEHGSLAGFQLVLPERVTLKNFVQVPVSMFASRHMEKLFQERLVALGLAKDAIVAHTRSDEYLVVLRGASSILSLLASFCLTRG